MYRVSRTIYVDVDSPNLGFPYFNFLGGYQLKKHPVSAALLLRRYLLLCRRGNRSVESCQVSTYHQVCNSSTKCTFVGGEVSDVGVTHHPQSVPVCTRALITLWPMLCAATNRMHGKETFLITDINEAVAVVKLLGNHKVYFSSWMFRDSFNWVTR